MTVLRLIASSVNKITTATSEETRTLESNGWFEPCMEWGISRLDGGGFGVDIDGKIVMVAAATSP